MVIECFKLSSTPGSAGSPLSRKIASPGRSTGASNGFLKTAIGLARFRQRSSATGCHR